MTAPATLTSAQMDRLVYPKLAVVGACWIWLGRVRNSKGYGSVGCPQVYVHRAVYEHLVGPIPEGLQLDHLCRNPRCALPAHLEPVTQRENILRGVSPSAHHARQTECRNGHALTPDNITVSRNGRGTPGRKCRVCARAAARKHYAGRRDA